MLWAGLWVAWPAGRSWRRDFWPLTTVTRTPARVFGVADHLGTVEPGRIADLTLVDGDPFTDFADLIRVRATVRGGTLTERAVLERGFTHPAAPGSPPGPLPGSLPGSLPVDWRTVLHQMLKDGCCSAHS